MALNVDKETFPNSDWAIWFCKFSNNKDGSFFRELHIIPDDLLTGSPRKEQCKHGKKLQPFPALIDVAI